ncbi:MAG: hypothetical protein HYY06_22725 [Deltaproteobacteria bacterium]|nr:hypothetical protein [Deltaproteobacteria bacterium]
MRGTLGAICLFSALTGATSAQATEVAGRVVIKGSLAVVQEPASRRPRYYWSLDNGVLPARADRILPERDLAIILVERGRPAVRRTSSPVVIRVAEGGMLPSSVVVRPGTMIRFENDDAFEHELYSPTHPDLAPESMARGQTRPFVAPQSGRIEIRCKRAPHLRGWIAVQDAVHFVAPRPDGTFTLTAEPGLYTVRTLYEGRWVAERELLVEDSRTVQTVEIEVDAAIVRPPAPAAAVPPPAQPVGVPAQSTTPTTPPPPPR